MSAPITLERASQRVFSTIWEQIETNAQSAANLEPLNFETSALWDEDPEDAQVEIMQRKVFDAMLQSIETLEKTTQHYGAQPSAACRYALVALADELIPRHIPALAIRWRNRLQRHYFNENTAGTGFFQRLATWRQQAMRQLPGSQTGDQAPARTKSQEVLRIYTMCLAFGFRGKYAIGQNDELAQIRQNLAQDLGLQGEPSPLSSLVRPQAPPRPFPIYRRTWAALAAILITLGIFTALALHLEARSSLILAKIHEQTTQV